MNITAVQDGEYKCTNNADKICKILEPIIGKYYLIHDSDPNNFQKTGMVIISVRKLLVQQANLSVRYVTCLKKPVK